MFALALAIAPRHAPALCCLGIVAIALLIDASGVSHPSVRFYARPLVFEFVFGVCVFYLFVAAERHPGWFSRHAAIRWGLWAIALGAVLLIGLEESHAGFGLPRFLVGGVPAAVLVLAALLLERLYGTSATSTIVFMIGESSYILYLIHPYVVYGLLRTMRWQVVNLPVPATVALVVALVVASTAAAIAIHVWFEKPVIVGLRRRVLRRTETTACAGGVDRNDDRSSKAPKGRHERQETGVEAAHGI
jgi:peptidoglycan/LPS O-acetylase OafA/YrhL